MFYHVTVKLESQLTSLEGKFENPWEDPLTYVFLTNQLPDRLEFVVITVMMAGVHVDFEYFLTEWFYNCLGLLIREPITTEQISFYEIDREIALKGLKQSVKYLKSIEDILNMSKRFDFELEETSTTFEPIDQDLKQQIAPIRKAIESLSLRTNCFILNPKSRNEQSYGLSLLIKKLMSSDRLLSTTTYRFDVPYAETEVWVTRFNDQSFRNTVFGKSIVISLDYAKVFCDDYGGLRESFVTSTLKLSKLIPIIFIFEPQVSLFHLNTLSELFNAEIISEA